MTEPIPILSGRHGTEPDTVGFATEDEETGMTHRQLTEPGTEERR